MRTCTHVLTVSVVFVYTFLICVVGVYVYTLALFLCRVEYQLLDPGISHLLSSKMTPDLVGTSCIFLGNNSWSVILVLPSLISLS